MGNDYRVFNEISDEIKKAMYVEGFENEIEEVSKFIFRKNERISYKVQGNRYFVNSFYPSFPSESWNRIVKGFSNIVNKVIRVPIQADIVVTGKCHCKCWHCFRIKANNEDLSLNEIKECMKTLYDMGTATIGITGGEPMLRSDICEIISAIPNGIEAQLYTTGHNITSQFVDFIKNSNLTRVIISLDHFDKEISCKMRSYENAYDEAISAIRLLVEKGIYTAVTVCVTESMLSENSLESYFEFVSSLHPNEIRVVMPIPQGNLEGTDVAKVYSAAVKFVKNIKKEYQSNSEFPTIVNFCEFESAAYLGCSAGAHYISINNDGNVTPCVAVPLSFGNIREEKLESIFEKMGKYFPKSGRICYGKTSGKVISLENIDTSITPISKEQSIIVADKCRKSSQRAAFFECFDRKGKSEI